VIYTYIGDILLAVNPFVTIDIYGEEVRRRGGKGEKEGREGEGEGRESRDCERRLLRE